MPFQFGISPNKKPDESCKFLDVRGPLRDDVGSADHGYTARVKDIIESQLGSWIQDIVMQAPGQAGINDPNFRMTSGNGSSCTWQLL